MKKIGFLHHDVGKIDPEFPRDTEEKTEHMATWHRVCRACAHILDAKGLFRSDGLSLPSCIYSERDYIEGDPAQFFPFSLISF